MISESPSEAERRLELLEAQVRMLEVGTGRAARGLEDHEERLSRVERLLRVSLHAERLEERER